VGVVSPLGFKRCLCRVAWMWLAHIVTDAEEKINGELCGVERRLRKSVVYRRFAGFCSFLDLIVWHCCLTEDFRSLASDSFEVSL